MLSKEERKHYDRHIILNEIGESGQEKLQNSKVLIIGAGGLGCPALQYLTAAGIGTIGIIDPDTVSQSNLQRQVLYNYDDIGKSKASVAATKLSRLNPHVKFEVHERALSSENAIALFNNYDVIVDGSDNFPTRYLANDAAILTHKPLVFGAIFKFEGQLSVFNYKEGPSYRCLYPTAPEPGDSPSCAEIGVLGVLPGIIGGLQANEVLKIVLNLGEVASGKLVTYDTLTHRQLQLSFDKTEAANVNQLLNDYEHFCGLSTVSKTSFRLEELTAQTHDFHLLDVREDWERELYHIGGQHIPLAELKQRYQEIPSSKKIVVYCKSGIRSHSAIQLLNSIAPELKLLQLEGGIKEA